MNLDSEKYVFLINFGFNYLLRAAFTFTFFESLNLRSEIYKLKVFNLQILIM